MRLLFLFILIFPTMTTVAQQTNIHFSHTDSTQAPSDHIWQIWTDISNWKQWDKGLKDAFLEGSFQVGAKGKLIPDKGPKSRFIISEVVPDQSYTFKTKIPFGWLVITRTLEVKDEITYFTHDVEFTGILKKILGNKLGKNYRTMLPEVMAEIKRIAESR